MRAIYCCPSVSQFQFWEPWTHDQVDQYIDQQRQIKIGAPGVELSLGVVLIPSGQMIGVIVVTILSVDDRQAEIRFTFNPDFGGRGYATLAVSVLLGIAFGRIRMHRVIAATDVRNERSWRLMERLGMRREAHFIHDNFVKGNGLIATSMPCWRVNGENYSQVANVCTGLASHD